MVIAIVLLVLAIILVMVIRKIELIRLGHKFWRTVTVFGIPLLAMAVVGALALPNHQADGTSGTTTTTAQAKGGSSTPSSSAIPPSTASPQEVRNAVIQALTVTKASARCAELVREHGNKFLTVKGQKYIKADVGAVKGSPPRKWLDALSTALQGKTPKQQLEYLQLSNCRDPEQGRSYANMLTTLVVDGVSVLKQNPWLAHDVDVKQVNDKAVSDMSVINLTDSSADDVFVTAGWQHQADLINTLLRRFQIVGDKALPSAKNWHLVGGGLVAGMLPEVGLNTRQEKLPALVLQVTVKGAPCPLLQIGANLGDQRPEVFKTPVCKPASKPSKTTSKGGVSTGPGGKTTTTTRRRVTTTTCGSLKCKAATTTPGEPVVNTTTPTAPNNGGHGGSGDGEVNTTTPPTTSSPTPTMPHPPSTTTDPTTPTGA